MLYSTLELNLLQHVYLPVQYIQCAQSTALHKLNATYMVCLILTSCVCMYTYIMFVCDYVLHNHKLSMAIFGHISDCGYVLHSHSLRCT